MTLKVDVFFGSASDERVYSQLVDLLASLGIEHRLEVCSAHRNPDRLRELVKASEADLFIAGAGLSAHLPGAIAAHSLKPVIGLPCQDVMKGLDALIACMQMPSGVPVLTAGIENMKTLEHFLRQYQAVRQKAPTLGLYYPASAEPMMASFKNLLAEFPFTLDTDPHGGHHEDIVAYFIDLLEPDLTPLQRKDAICIPYLSEDKPWDPRILMELTEKGGLWVGINTYKNAALALIQLWNPNSQWNSHLQHARGGVPVHA